MRSGLFLLTCLASTAAAQTIRPSISQWRDSLDLLAADIKSIHPNAFTKVGRLSFERELAKLQSDLPSLTEEQRMVGAMRLVASVGDGHTNLEPTGPEWRSWYPLRMMEFADGYYVTSAHRSVGDLAGAQVLELAGRPIDRVAEAARDLMGTDNRFDRKNRLYAIHNERLMRGLGFVSADGSLRIKARLRNGKVVERTLRAAPQDDPRFTAADTMLEWVYPSEVYGLGIGTADQWVAAFAKTPSSAFLKAEPSRPVHLTERTRYFARALPEKQAYYIQLNQVDDTTFLRFLEDAMAEVDRVKPKRLIMDMRNNFGGDASRALEAVHSLVRRSQTPPWGSLYVLTGPKTFSAAVLTLDEILDNLEATLVGEPAGAPLNTYGDAVARLYSQAGFRADISTLWHQRSDSNDIRSFLPVDVPAPLKFADYIRGGDSAVDPILNGEEMRSIPEIVRSDGAAKARTVYAARKAQFGHLDWWSPPPEIELRRACDYHIDGKRFPEALDACTLTSEIHPYVWNSWYNLGQAQRQAGLMQERLASYRCVLAIYPTNFNGPALRKAIADSKVAVPLAPGCPIPGP
jgi:hypothetical protein